jgi:prolyl 4-hydroxylase
MKTAQPVEAPVLPMGVMPTAKPAEASGPNYLPLNLYYPGLKKVFDSPPIYIVENFLTMEECEAFKVTASPLLQRSKTHAIAGSEATKGRTSLTCHLAKKAHPSPILLQKIQALTNKPFGHMELPQVARYTDSQRYVEHYDGVDPHTDAGRAFCSNGGQRVATVLCYLNDVADGGSTAFRRVNFEVKPKKGNALIFFPGFMNGELDTDALHAGMPAVDTKWVSQVWIRQYFREDGQPSSPVPDSERTLVGPLHKGFYRGHCLAGDDILEAVMTIEEAMQWASNNKQCFGFTYNSANRDVDGPIRIWFKSKLNVLYNESWWSWSTGLGMSD